MADPQASAPNASYASAAADGSADAQPETLLWEGHPSQWTNFGLYLLCLITCVLVVPIFIAGWRWLETRRHWYRVTSERVITTQGVLSKRTDELELYRVKDTSLLEPFWLRLVSRGHVDLSTSDRSTPGLRLKAIPNASALREQLRRAIEQQRRRRGIREIDIGDSGV